ncbi:hypothetical protein AAU57_08635 [Nonlabens sp. YIK11]|uniref:DUF6377 domain-containing protein n=1 Tax=Nonlabens sp. YIK11 TaxID=1453349 RepID=UPI0006DC8E63|nr:DUF6377 domain-containing protein [Nonlabens sp. YIK11]KQC33372.1 hypothetical protein AAU57_08635 [Nonlabens sp. YIK11]
MGLKSFLFLLIIFSAFLGLSQENELLNDLDAAINKRKEYESAKLQNIKKIKSRLEQAVTNDYQAYREREKLIDLYKDYNLDSTVYHISKNISTAKRIGYDSLLIKSQLQLASKLSSSGNYKEAFDILENIPKDNLTKANRYTYLYEFSLLYKQMGNYTPLQESSDSYLMQYKTYADSLLDELPRQSDLYKYMLQMRLRDDGKLKESLDINLELLEKLSPDSREYAGLTFFISSIYNSLGNVEKRRAYLAKSATADIKAAVKDNASLADLAVDRFQQGEVEKAHEYINIAFEDAKQYNSKLRFVTIANVLPAINQAYETELQAQKRSLWVSIIVISLMAVLLTLAIIYINKQLKRIVEARRGLEKVNEKLLNTNNELVDLSEELRKTNTIKEHYIGSLLGLSSNYLNKLDGYRKTVTKMLLRKEYDELLKRTKSHDVIKEEQRSFYNNFDNIFLQIYPDFVAQVNSLLREDEQIQIKKDELLTPELRIYALIRLGICDSSKIAELLHYSVNTIYNYRVKLKNKSRGDRDLFEEEVKQIT